jgi:hypothetical protein
MADETKPDSEIKALRDELKALKKKPDKKAEVGYMAEIASLKSEKLELNKQLKVAVRSHGLFQSIAEELNDLVEPMDSLPSAIPAKDKKAKSESLVIHLSDLHADEIVLPHQVGGTEAFDFKIACCRAEKYIADTLDWAAGQSRLNFDVAHVFAYGDNSSGEIHDSVGRSEFKNQFKNCFAIGQLMALMYRDLASAFPHVKVYCLPGNHGRRSVKKDFHGAQNNWDFLIYKISELHCADLKNVEFIIPDAFSMVVNIEGYGFQIQHGDDIKSWNGIPFYGIERKNRRTVSLQAALGNKIDYFVLGHFHALTTSADLKGETIINGAFPATNPYGYESFSGYREPMQLIHGVSKNYGATWRLPVKIKDPIAEAKGPKRYKVDFENYKMAVPFTAGLAPYVPKQ